MKVKDLVVHLLTGNQDAEVVVLDHFGRPVRIDLGDFCFETYKRGESPQGLIGDFLRVSSIDIGPEPE